MSLQPSIENVAWCNHRKMLDEDAKKKEESEINQRIIKDLPFTTSEQIVEWISTTERTWKDYDELRLPKHPNHIEWMKKCKEYISTLENPPIYVPNPPLPNPNPQHPGEYTHPVTMPLNPGSVQPSLTTTIPRENVVQWTQGNRIIMRPHDREVLPGQKMTSVKIIGKK